MVLLGFCIIQRSNEPIKGSTSLHIFFIKPPDFFMMKIKKETETKIVSKILLKILFKNTI